MKTKKILGLDLGTNSIGWALVENELNEKHGKIIGMGSRIIPMSKRVINDFDKGVTKSQTAERTSHRGVRRMYERSHIRRERLLRVLHLMGYLPSEFSEEIDFNKRKGKFLMCQEPLLAYSNERDELGKRKFQFLNSYAEMEEEFRRVHPDLPHKNKKGTDYKLPYDWTLYYLRKKALKQEISNAELAWILLNFNQKRGYYQSRDEQEQNVDEGKSVEYKILTAKEFTDSGEKVDDKTLYNITFDNGWEYDKTTTKPEIWKDLPKEFIVTTKTNKDGTIRRSYRAVDSEKDWEAIKRKTEQDLGDDFVGKYIYESILKNPQQKVRGELIRTIDRDFYFDELEVILRTQATYREKEWSDKALFKKAAEELYPNNDEHREELIRNKDGFIHLFLKDILFYHRPPKSQKSLISKCQFEYRTYKDKESNQKVKAYINGMPKSKPLFQEFRIWQLAHNLQLQQREVHNAGKIELNKNITSDYIKTYEDFANLFEFLYNKSQITQKQFIAYFIKDKKQQAEYKWNYPDDDKIKLECNQTRPMLLSKMSKEDKKKLTSKLENKLWHIIYSVTDKQEYDKAIDKLVEENQLSEETRKKLERTPMLKKEYASYSEKAVKKLISLMRAGKYWKEGDIDGNTKNRIEKIITGEVDENVENRVRELGKNFSSEENFQGLPLWFASYIIYGKHSEVDAQAWQNSKELEVYIKNFKQHSLRNPIVEQVMLESLRVTLDLWEHYGEELNVPFETYTEESTGSEKKSYQRVFDQIHIEIGRDLKNPKKVREKIFNRNNKNKDTNQRIRKLLFELKNHTDVKNIHPNSKTHFDKLKIFEQTILGQYSDKELENEKIDTKLSVDKFIKKDQPTSEEIVKYRLWLEQKYQSPYTQNVIPLSDLFTTKYEVEHIIPQSRFFDNSFNNKVICEANVNRLKDNRTGYAFIQEFQDTKVPIDGGGSVTVSIPSAYEKFATDHYDGKKLDNLLREDIPQKMGARQETDMRYITKAALKIYSNIVREKGEKESTVKNVLPVAGGVTAKLRREWGLNAVWSELVEDRFRRLNRLICGPENEDNGLFGSIQKDGGFFRPEVPLELRPDFEIKRIDHRHHALDALIVACTTRSHVNYLNNQSAKSDKKRYDLGRTLRNTEQVELTNPVTGEKSKRTVLGDFKKPWNSFTGDAKTALQHIVISFKQNLRAINKATNHNWRYKNENGEYLRDKNGRKKKQRVPQAKGAKNWAIRKPLHEDTYFGILENGPLKGNLVKREPLNASFTEKKINDVVDSTVRKILLKHLKQDKFLNQKDEKDNDLTPSQAAFSAKGLEDLNENIIELNNGVFHHPIKKVRLKFTKGKQFAIKKWDGKEGELLRETKFVKSAKGTNLYFCIYEKEGKRKYYVPTFEEIIEIQKQEQELPPEQKKNVPEAHPDHPDYHLKFYLQPNDLVYVPNENEEKIDLNHLTQKQLKQIYLFKDGSGVTANFIPMYSADVIYNLKDNKKRKAFAKQYGLDYENLIKNEYGLGSPQLKSQNTIEEIQVKEFCWKLEVDRLGNIVKILK